MRLSQGLRARPSQRLTLSPAVRLGLRVLRLPLSDLEDLVAQEAEANPLLTVTRAAPRMTGTAPTHEIAAHHTIASRLDLQIREMPVSPTVRDTALYIVNDLDDDGFWADTPAMLSRHLGVPVDVAEAALAAVQSCSPTGIGARDVLDCLRLQLQARDVPETEARAAMSELALIVRGQWATAARLTGISASRLREIAALLPHLNPRPGVDLDDTAPEILVPDVTVSLDESGVPQVTLATATRLTLRVDRALHRALCAAPESRDNAERLKASADALRRGVRFRELTLVRVCRALVKAQHRFFAVGPDSLVPLTRQDIAQQIGASPSTVGRAIAGKALAWDGRVIPLRSFLSAGLGNKRTGAVAALVVQRKIGRIVAGEAPTAPLSDEEIVEILAQDGVDIARRTVAKYR